MARLRSSELSCGRRVGSPEGREPGGQPSPGGKGGQLGLQCWRAAAGIRSTGQPSRHHPPSGGGAPAGRRWPRRPPPGTRCRQSPWGCPSCLRPAQQGARVRRSGCGVARQQRGVRGSRSSSTARRRVEESVCSSAAAAGHRQRQQQWRRQATGSSSGGARLARARSIHPCSGSHARCGGPSTHPPVRMVTRLTVPHDWKCICSSSGVHE